MMKQQYNRQQHQRSEVPNWMVSGVTAVSTPVALGLILLVALIAFEMFNFDTTRFALANLLGDVRFVGVPWAAILAVAFCAIDFAGLVRFFMPNEEANQQLAGRQTEYWYLTGAWLLGATMNAIMTWWAVSLTLLNHELGNEILSRAQLLEIVPIFVAALVWLTRILFIGAFTVAGGYLFAGFGKRPSAIQQPAATKSRMVHPQRQPQPVRAVQLAQVEPAPMLPDIDTMPAFLAQNSEPEMIEFDEPLPVFPASAPPVNTPQPAVPAAKSRPQSAPHSRIQRRPPAPNSVRRAPVPMGAKGRSQR